MTTEGDLTTICRLAFTGEVKAHPELVRRIRERAAQVRREMREKQGVTNIAVDLVREVRSAE